MDSNGIIKNIGKNIKIARVIKDWTQEEFSAACGLTVTTISLIENGINNDIRLQSLLSIVDSLEITIEELFVQRNQNTCLVEINETKS